MLYDRHEPRQYAEANREKCQYCHHEPGSWQYINNEKVCPHCGTRVLISLVPPLKNFPSMSKQ
jgi:DNA-directed RNA polymerase subunit RPC12/RpoP